MTLIRIPIHPREIFSSFKRTNARIEVSQNVIASASNPIEQTLATLNTSLVGLTQEEAEERIKEHGPNVVSRDQRFVKLKLFLKALAEVRWVILLAILAAFTFATAGTTSDMIGGIVMTLMIVLGVSLRFIQESRADSAAAKLRAMIRVTATVLRDGKPVEIPLEDLVPGDIVKLCRRRYMIPADLRIISCKDLFLDQASLTGESFPVEKFDVLEASSGVQPLELKNICFLGTSVESGSATAIAVETGLHTYLGGLASAVTSAPPPTAFDKGVSRFTWLMIRFMAVMVPLVFLINGISKHDWGEAFMFALAVAVGLTPEMLPMIVSVCLSKGAMLMSKKKVIVKRLNSIQNLGAMDVLCTDKTGTLTMDKVVLEYHCDVAGEEDNGVLELAVLNSYFQTGLRNVLDSAILKFHDQQGDSKIADYTKADEIPFDFQRKMMSVIVATPEAQPSSDLQGRAGIRFSQMFAYMS